MIFNVEIVIFAITIYGAVVAGGLALKQLADRENAREQGETQVAEPA